MVLRVASSLTVLLAVTVLCGCDRQADAKATPRPVAEADPSAPAPGTQAAEAIGVDSPSRAPETRRR